MTPAASTPYMPAVSTVVATVTSTFTQTYCVTLPAACPTKEWTATYDIVEICTGNPAEWTPPPCPTNFVVTTVSCDVCDGGEKVITCPNALATEINIKVIGGSGVTATVNPWEAVYPTFVPECDEEEENGKHKCPPGGCPSPEVCKTCPPPECAKCLPPPPVVYYGAQSPAPMAPECAKCPPPRPECEFCPPPPPKPPVCENCPTPPEPPCDECAPKPPVCKDCPVEPPACDMTKYPHGCPPPAPPPAPAPIVCDGKNGTCPKPPAPAPAPVPACDMTKYPNGCPQTKTPIVIVSGASTPVRGGAFLAGALALAILHYLA